MSKLSPLSNMGVISSELVWFVWPCMINFSTWSLTPSILLTLALMRRHLTRASEDKQTTITINPEIFYEFS